MGLSSRLLGIVWLAQQASGQVLYSPVQVSTIGSNDPIEFADLNGDGRIDLAGDGAIAFSDGLGAFSAPQAFPPPTYYLRFCAADFDRDGRMDLVANGSSGLEFLRGVGAGAFAAGTPVMSPAPAWRAAADVDNDGDPDLVAFMANPSRLRVALSNGDGTFAIQPDLALGVTVLDGAVGRIDGDAFVDVALLPSNGASLLVLLGQANGQFGAPTSVPGTQGAVCFRLPDLELDGDRDLAFATAAVTTVLRNDGAGHFVPSASLPVPSVQSIRDGDLNVDGWTDLLLVVQPAAGGGLHAALGDGVGGFSAPVAYGFKLPKESLAVTDVDVDGIPDVLMNAWGDGMCRLRGLGGGRLESLSRWSTQGRARGIAAADFDGDGHVDVATARASSVGLMLGDGHAGLAPPITTPLGYDNSDVCTADFDGDGDLDLAVAEFSAWRLQVLLNDGSGAFPSAQPIGYVSSPIMVRAADQDGDQLVDLAALEYTLGNIFVLRGDGAGSFAPVGSVALGASSQYQRSFLFADVNGDARADLIGVSMFAFGPDEVRVFISTGPGTFSLQQSFPIEAFATSHNAVFAAGDFDSDGDLDLAVGHGANNGRVRLYQNDSTGSFALFATSTLANGEITSLEFGNVDANPHQDLIAGSSAFSFLVYLNIDTGLGAPQVYVGGQGPGRMALVDMDEDGWPDAVSGANFYIDDDLTISPSVSPYLEPPTVYCTAKTNSLGCVPAIGASGTPSASATSGFVLHATNVISNKYGLLAYGFAGRATMPFAGGTLCVKSPIKRTPGVYAGGTPTPPFDCSGEFAIDLNAFAHGALGGNPSPLLLQPGHVVVCQWWGRDPGFPSGQNVQLSDALEFALHP